MKKLFLFYALCCFFYSSIAQEIVPSDSLIQLSFEELLNTKVSTPSKKNEALNNAPAIVSLITSDEITKFGANNLIEVLDRASNIYTFSTFNSNGIVALRGKQTGNSSIHILLLLDGRPLRVSLDGAFNGLLFNMIPLSIIDRIEIVRGPGSVLYGTNAYVGIINIITKTVTKSSITTKLQYGTFNNVQASIGFTKKIKDLTILGGIYGIKTDGWDFTARGESNVIRNKANTQDSLFLNPTTIQKDEKGVSGFLKVTYKNISNNTFYGVNDWAMMNVNSNWRNDAATRSFRIQNDRFFNDLNYSTNISEKWKITLNNTINYQNCIFHSPDFKNDIQKSTSFDYLVEVSNHFELTEKTNLLVGIINNQQTGYVEQFNYNSQAKVIDISTNTNDDPWYSLPKYNYANQSAYLQADFSPTKFLKLISGIQANKVPLLKTDIVPRLGIILSPNKKLNFKILYGEAFRSATSIEKGVRFVNSLQGTNDLLPEKIKTFDANVNFNTSFLSVSFTYFNSFEQNVISRVTAIDTLYFDGFSMVFPSRYTNVGSITTNGCELESQFKISPSFSGNHSLSYYQTINDKKQINYGGLPVFMTKLGVNYTFKKLLLIGVYHSYFGQNGDPFLYDEKGNKLTKMGNPSYQPFHYTSINVLLQMKELIPAFPKSQLGLYVTNIFNEKVYTPELNRRLINTLPGRAGRAFNINYSIQF